jgi:hypothetical protein
MSQTPQHHEAPEPPAMGERRARWGYGYQDKVATDRILRILKDDLRDGSAVFEGVRLADLQAGRVDDFVLVWNRRVEGNSIKWSGDASPMNWGDLIGAKGLIKELAQGFLELRQRWPDRTVTVRLQTNRPPSLETHANQIISAFSVAEFLRDHWEKGPTAQDSEVLKEAWGTIAKHVGLSAAVADFGEFVKGCIFSLGVAEPPGSGPDTRDWRHYKRQFDELHKAIATWLTNNPNLDFINREFLFAAIGFHRYRSELVQRFPPPQIPYEQNATAAEQLKQLIEAVPGGYIAVTGCAGIGKSTLVQDVLSNADYPFFIPYYAFLPDGEGNPRDRGEALTFFQDVIGRLDKFFPDTYSLGITDVAQGREALRQHMAKAHAHYVLQGRKTILLVDGLDHVSREVGLQSSILHELPRPDEVPEGFLIILSSQPQALEPGTIRADVGIAISVESGRRVEVTGLSRAEVHAIVTKVAKPTSADDRDRLNEDCQGNPLILTYLLNIFQRSPETSVNDAIAEVGSYDGDIDKYYATALSVPLRVFQTKKLLALLCRAAPTIPMNWLRSWPEYGPFEDLYWHSLAPFVREEDRNLHFIHNSLIAFLKTETRSKLLGVDHAVDEHEYHSMLADRSSGLPCANPLGRAHILHLLRAGRKRELLTVLTSSWLREALGAFLPYALVRPLLLAGLEAAWTLGEYGHVMRFVLLDHELGQRTARMEAGELADRMLRLNLPNLALSQARSGGRLLVDDKVALVFAQSLWYYADSRDSQPLKAAARTLYLQAKPIAFVYHGEPIDTSRHHDYYSVLRAWSEVAPFFEATQDIVKQVNALQFTIDERREEVSQASVKCGLLYGALLTMLEAGLDLEARDTLLHALKEMEQPDRYFAALLAIARRDPEAVSTTDLKAAYAHCARNDDFSLALAKHLYRIGDHDDARAIVSGLAHIRFDTLKKGRDLGFNDTTFTVDFRCLQDLLAMPEGPVPGVKDDHEEALARIEAAARQLGIMLAAAIAGKAIPDLRGAFRSVLLFHNRPVSLPKYDRRGEHVIIPSKMDVYRQISRIASAFGTKGVEALRDLVLEITAGPAASQLAAHHRRYFAEELFYEGVLNREEAVTLGLSLISDVQDDDPMHRQDACLDIATFLHAVGDEDRCREWIRRASEVSAGTGSHKDYHMAQLAEWLDRAVASSLTTSNLEVLEKFARAVEVAGGAGQSSAGTQMLCTVIRLESSRASALAIEFIDRGVLNLSTTIEALVIGGAKAGASYPLLFAIYSELLSLVDPGSTGSAAVAILNRAPFEQRTTAAQELMSHVRTNSLPSYRIEVARALQHALQEARVGEVNLSEGLQPSRDDSSRKTALYRLTSGETLSADQVAARLSRADSPGDWNPNPAENGDFDWWSAVKRARIQSLDHLNDLIATFPPPEYRTVELLTRISEWMLTSGNRNAARDLAERAIKTARDGSWFRQYDGAQKKIAYGALQSVAPQEGIARAREQFGRDLIAGRLNNYLLMEEIVDLFQFLELGWPADGVFDAVGVYLNEVLAANQKVEPYRSLSDSKIPASVDEALCRFLVQLLGFPVVDIGIAARRCLAKYVEQDGRALANVLLAEPCWDAVQFEHILVALHVGSLKIPSALDPLWEFIIGLNRHESVAVRGIARRICQEQRWAWMEIHDLPSPKQLLIPTPITAQATYKEDRMLVGGGVAIAADVYRAIFHILEECGNDLNELASEFTRIYSEIEQSYTWKDDVRLRRWMRMALARHWLHQRALVGREVAMRLLGRRALSGQAGRGAEQAYDFFYPLYDPALELIEPRERPSEMLAMNWDFWGERGKDWLQGLDATDWNHYPTSVGGLRLIAERSWFTRPDWEWPREERYRGVLIDSEGDAPDRASLASGHELTYEGYIRGDAQRENQLIIWNNDLHLAGPQYRWVAMNSNVAQELGWTVCPTNPFEWQDSAGHLMVKSEYWKDGWIWLKPPRFEALGEGWYVLASDLAVEAIQRAFPDAQIHLWVERYSHGQKPYKGSWHLRRPF